MSDLASRLAAAPASTTRVRKGPTAACAVYGTGDLDDARALHDRLAAGETWKEAQSVMDPLVGISTPIHNDKFRYHWSAKCGHWTDEQRHELRTYLADEDAA